MSNLSTNECIVLDKANEIYLLGWRGIIETIVFNMVLGCVSIPLIILNTGDISQLLFTFASFSFSSLRQFECFIPNVNQTTMIGTSG